MDITGITGLTKEEVKERIRRHLDNENVAAQTRTVKEIIKENTCTYFNLIFLVLSILVIISGEYRDLTFLPVIVINTLIGIVQEVHSKKVLDRLTLLHEPKVTVLRDGKRVQIPSAKLVQDDCLVLEAGVQIPADATVLSGSISVNESLLTGESDEIEKSANSELLSGSFVVSGSCMARAIRVGSASYAAKLTLQATKEKRSEQSKMIRSMNILLKIIGVLIIPIGILLFVQAYVYNHASFRGAISGMVAALIGMIPEGLYLLTSVALAVSALRLGRKQVLLHNMKCIETLARVDVLCVDKTGTVTEPEMVVQELIPINGDTERLTVLLSDFAAAMDGGNDTMQAIKQAFADGNGRRAKTVFDFSSKYKYSGVTFSEDTFVLGAPEFVLQEHYVEVKERVEAEAEKGLRVLALARYEGSLDGKMLNAPTKLLALITLKNPIRKGAKETFSYFAKEGVSIKVISGDNPMTVSKTALDAGIAGAESYIDARTLKTKEDIRRAIKEVTVFGRVVPEQKKQLVKAFQKAGHTVAMTGDGVNDILALKEADCSIAMASGSDAASQAAQLVLLDSDFSRMPSVVAEGRRVVNNIERTASLYLVKNLFSLMLAVFSVVFMFEYPLTPAQVSLISIFTIGIPSFVLALEPNTNRIHGKFMVNVLLKALPAGLTGFAVVSGLVLFCREFRVDTESLSTSCTILVAIVGFMIVRRIIGKMRLHHYVLLLGVILGWAYCMLFISHFFEITGLSRQVAMLMVVFALATEPLMRYMSRFFWWILGLLHAREDASYQE